MKISIWQQFSSNHSGFFWVAGTFEKIEDANEAYRKLRGMLQRIDIWHRENPDLSRRRFESPEALPPEQEIAEEYGIEWKYTIDWTNWVNYQYDNDPSIPNHDAQRNTAELIDKVLVQVGNVLIASTPDQTWMTQEPFNSLMQKLGAKTVGVDLEFIESDAGAGFNMTSQLTFTALDAATADQIERDVQRYLQGELASLDNVPPWHDLQTNLPMALARASLLNQVQVDILERLWNQRLALYEYIKAPIAQEFPRKKLALNKSPDVIRDWRDFTLADISFHHTEYGATALIAYLEANGCTDIHYAFKQIPPEQREMNTFKQKSHLP